MWTAEQKLSELTAKLLQDGTDYQIALYEYAKDKKFNPTFKYFFEYNSRIKESFQKYLEKCARQEVITRCKLLLEEYLQDFDFQDNYLTIIQNDIKVSLQQYYDISNLIRVVSNIEELSEHFAKALVIFTNDTIHVNKVAYTYHDIFKYEDPGTFLNHILHKPYSLIYFRNMFSD